MRTTVYKNYELFVNNEFKMVPQRHVSVMRAPRPLEGNTAFASCALCACLALSFCCYVWNIEFAKTLFFSNLQLAIHKNIRLYFYTLIL